jgi:hypothetical protein
LHAATELIPAVAVEHFATEPDRPRPYPEQAQHAGEPASVKTIAAPTRSPSNEEYTSPSR